LSPSISRASVAPLSWRLSLVVGAVMVRPSDPVFYRVVEFALAEPVDFRLWIWKIGVMRVRS
jgi:hypothetical protein